MRAQWPRCSAASADRLAGTFSRTQSLTIVKDDKLAFGERVVASLSADPRVIRGTFDGSTFAVEVVTSRGNFTFFLASLFKQYADAAGDREEVLQRWVGSVLDAVAQGALPSQLPPPRTRPPSARSTLPADRRARIFPHVADRVFWSIVKLQSEVAGEKVGARIVPMGALDLSLCEDTEAGIRIVTPAELVAMGTNFEAMMTEATQNLARSTRDARFTTPCPGVYLSPWRDGHDATRAVLLDVTEALKVEGDEVLFLPSTDTVIVTGAQNSAGLLAAAELAIKAYEQAKKPLLGYPLRQARGCEPALLELPPGHPAGKALRRLQALALASSYGTQHGLLVAIYKRTGRDIFVADCLTGRDPVSGETVTMCTWSPVPTLLPVTDVLALTSVESGPDGAPRQSRPAVVATRVAVESVIPRLKAAQRVLMPPRIVADFFPTVAELDAIERMVAVQKRSG